MKFFKHLPLFQLYIDNILLLYLMTSRIEIGMTSPMTKSFSRYFGFLFDSFHHTRCVHIKIKFLWCLVVNYTIIFSNLWSKNTKKVDTIDLLNLPSVFLFIACIKPQMLLFDKIIWTFFFRFLSHGNHYCSD